MNENIIILALETLEEQVLSGTDWSCEIETLEWQSRLDEIREEIDSMKRELHVIKLIANLSGGAKGYFDNYQLQDDYYQQLSVEEQEQIDEIYQEL
tara:strand:- start:431 stop:718 length:288 start_codon:yes stop_codon:yes gene_type:complete